MKNEIFGEVLGRCLGQWVWVADLSKETIESVASMLSREAKEVLDRSGAADRRVHFFYGWYENKPVIAWKTGNPDGLHLIYTKEIP